MATTMIKLRPWRTVPQRAYAPKPLDPGQRITWERETGPGERETRSGVVWSAGTSASSLWVLPDDDPRNAVEVKLPGKRDREWGCGMTEMRRPADWARAAMRRVEHFRRFGSLFATVEREYETYNRATWRQDTLQELRWHADPECPAAAGQKRSERESARSEREVIAILLGEVHPSNPRLCAHCVMLDEPAAAEHAHAA